MGQQGPEPWIVEGKAAAEAEQMGSVLDAGESLALARGDVSTGAEGADGTWWASW